MPKVKIASTQADFFALMRIRQQVFVIEQNVDLAIELDNQDTFAIHIIAYIDEIAVGTCRLLQIGGTVHAGRMAVLREYRKQHIGSCLLRFIEEQRQTLHYHTITLHAQCQAMPFYEKNGFHPLDQPFLEAGIIHQTMEKHYEPK